MGHNSLGSDGEYQAMGQGEDDLDAENVDGVSIVLVNYGIYAGVSLLLEGSLTRFREKKTALD
jgi:hypothetical protein